MSLRELEASILAELKIVANNPKLRIKDMAEWSTGPVKAQEGETLYHLPQHNVNVAVKVQPKVKKPTPKQDTQSETQEATRP